MITIPLLIFVAIIVLPSESGGETVELTPEREGWLKRVELVMERGDVLKFSWSATDNLDFQILVPDDFPKTDELGEGDPRFWNHNLTNSGDGELVAEVGGTYTLQWRNKSPLPVDLTYEYRVD